MRVNSFARNNLTEFVPLPEHHASLPPSVIYDVVLNYKWRFIITHLIEQLYDYNMRVLPVSELEDFDKVVNNLLDDIYS